MNKSFKQRLAELERLEAEAEAKRQAAEESGIPDLAAMDDRLIVFEAILGYRNRVLHPINHADGLGFTVSSTLSDEAWRPFYEALRDRVRPLLAGHDGPFIALGGWEVVDALALIDSGRVDVTCITYPGSRRLRCRLRLDMSARKDEEGERTIQACNHAVALWAFQLGYPETGDWELGTLAEWRAWLAGLLVEDSAE